MKTPFELNPTFCFTMLGACLIYLWTRPGRWALVALLLLATGLRTACILVMGSLGSYFGVWWISWGAFLGIASLIELAVEVVRSRPAERQALRQTFYAAAVFPVGSLLIGYAFPVITWLRPKTYDAFLLAFDGGLGFQPSFVLGRLPLRNAMLWGLSTSVYYALMLPVCALYGSYRLRKHPPVAVLSLFLSMLAVGFVLYTIFPAVGPGYAFHQSYPQHPPTFDQIVTAPMNVPNAPRNCMPSLHLAAALAVWWNARIWPRWGRSLAFLFLVATTFSTLALGEHYLADLVIAVPFTLIFQAAWTTSVGCSASVRRLSLWTGSALTVAWLVTLRYLLPVYLVSPFVSWGLILLTVGGCLMVERKLSEVSDLGVNPSRLSDSVKAC